MLADHLFSPSLLLAEHIERGLIPCCGRSGQPIAILPALLCPNIWPNNFRSTVQVIELGAGCALPSLLMATLPDPPSLVVVTDYPDAIILGNLSNNVEQNRHLFQKDCDVRCVGYEWGQDLGVLL